MLDNQQTDRPRAKGTTDSQHARKGQAEKNKQGNTDSEGHAEKDRHMAIS
jgi:hypothetical protein